MRTSTNTLLFCALVIGPLAGCGGGGSGVEIGPLFDDPTITIDPCLATVDSMSFGIVTDAELNTVYTSNEVTVSGLGEGCTEQISDTSNVDASSRSYSINGSTFGLTGASVKNGDRVRLRLVSPGLYGSVNYWYALGNSAFDVWSKHGSATDAPVVTILSPADQSSISARNIVVSGTATDSDGVASISILPTNGATYYPTSTDGFATWQVTIDLVTGSNVITVSSADSLNNQNPAAAEITVFNLLTVLEQPRAIESDLANLRLLVADKSHRALIAIDFATGLTDVLSDENTPDATNLFSDPAKLVVNSTGTTAWLLDRDYSDIVQVDLTTGLRTLLTDTVETTSPISLSQATDLVLDEVNSRILLVMGEDESTQVISLSLTSGQRTVLSNANTPNTDVPFGFPMSLALDTIGNHLLVIQRNTVDPSRTGNALIAVDPTTGQREIIIDDSILTGFPVDADVDIDHNRVLVLSNWTRDELLAFDFASDELTELFSLFPVSVDQIARDSLNNRMLLLQRFLIYAIDLETGEVSEAF